MKKLLSSETKSKSKKEKNLELNRIYKSALITGGAQRIGESIACYLANNGVNIAIQFNKSQKKAQELKNRFKNKKTKFSIYKFDFEQNKNISKCISWSLKTNYAIKNNS